MPSELFGEPTNNEFSEHSSAHDGTRNSETCRQGKHHNGYYDIPVILIVDDDADLRSSIAGFIRFEGFLTIQAANAHEALVLLSNNKPDLIISDFEMPGIDGLRLLELVRQRKELENIPAILCSASDEGKSKFKKINPALTSFLRKPFDTGIMLDLIFSYIGHHHTNNEFLAKPANDREYPAQPQKKTILVNTILQLFGYGECNVVTSEEPILFHEMPCNETFLKDHVADIFESAGFVYKYCDCLREEYIKNNTHYVVFYARYLSGSAGNNFIVIPERNSPGVIPEHRDSREHSP